VDPTPAENPSSAARQGAVAAKLRMNKNVRNPILLSCVTRPLHRIINAFHLPPMMVAAMVSWIIAEIE
jgi:hypothetical protein